MTAAPNVAPNPPAPNANAIQTWNFLRVSIVAAVAALGAAIVWELHLAPDECLQQSISAYFYTPARGVFTGALISIGVAMLCLRGSTPFENWFLNLAGVFAPLVALIPAPSGGDPGCTSYPGTAAGRLEGYANAMVAVFAVSGAFILAGVIRMLLDKADDKITARWQVAGAAVLWGVLLYLFAEERTFFDKKVHFASAIAMFAFAAVVIALNTWDTRRPDNGVIRSVYFASFLTMVVAAAVVLIVHFAADWEGHWVFWFEFVEIVPFTAFWLFQTIHMWNKPERPLHG